MGLGPACRELRASHVAPVLVPNIALATCLATRPALELGGGAGTEEASEARAGEGQIHLIQIFLNLQLPIKLPQEQRSAIKEGDGPTCSHSQLQENGAGGTWGPDLCPLTRVLRDTLAPMRSPLMPRKIEGWRKRERRRMRWLDGVTGSVDMNLSKLWEILKDRGTLACCSLWGHKESDTTKQLNNNEISRIHSLNCK